MLSIKILLLLSFSYLIVAQTQALEQLTQSSGQSEQGASALYALLLAAQEQHKPLGIEYVGQDIIGPHHRFNPHEKLSILAEQIRDAFPGYNFVEEKGALLLTNDKFRQQHTLLDTVIPRFELKRRATLQEAGKLLEMDLELQLNPQITGFAGSYPAGDLERKVEPFSIQGATVREILNLLVRSAQAAWVVTGDVSKTSVVPKRSPWLILEYENPPRDYRSVVQAALSGLGSNN